MEEVKRRREAERRGIATWGKFKGREEKYRRNSKQTGRHARERSYYKERLWANGEQSVVREKGGKPGKEDWKTVHVKMKVGRDRRKGRDKGRNTNASWLYSKWVLLYPESIDV